MSINSILCELASESGRNAKIEILKRNDKNMLLRRVFVAALDPYVQYYIKKIPPYQPGNESIGLLEAIGRLNSLAERKVTGHAAVDFLAETLSSVSEDDAQVIEKIIRKDLRCGVQASTVNKVWPKLIPTYPCLLGKGFDEKTIAKIKWPAAVQLKLDGMRVNIHVIEGKTVEIRGRSGKIIDLHGELDADALALYHTHTFADSGDSYVLDGELILVEDNGKVMDRQKGNGILNKAIRGTISKREAKKVRATLWDAIPMKDFKSCVCKTPYRTRFERLDVAVDLYNGTKFSIVEHHVVTNFDAAQELFQKALAEGQEGVMIKNLDSPWEDKRSTNLVKLKAELDCDLQVVDWVEGTGKYEGMLGALVCESADGKVRVHIGSGFSDDQRSAFRSTEVVGKIATVKYNERIKSKEKGREHLDSLFLPRFIELREDKSEADLSNKVK